jgi:hypothetical protein
MAYFFCQYTFNEDFYKKNTTTGVELKYYNDWVDFYAFLIFFEFLFILKQEKQC